jgi:hypothetical protein
MRDSSTRASSSTTDGHTIAGEGTAKEPILLVVEKSSRTAAPITSRWWFWAALGGILVAGTVTAIALSGDDSPTDDATVIITVNPP